MSLRIDVTPSSTSFAHCTSVARTRIGTAAGHLHGRVRMAAAQKKVQARRLYCNLEMEMGV